MGNVTALLTAALITARKFVQDTPHKNKIFSDMIKGDIAEVNRGELDFVFAIGFNLHVTPHEISEYKYLLTQFGLHRKSPTNILIPTAAEKITKIKTDLKSYGLSPGSIDIILQMSGDMELSLPCSPVYIDAKALQKYKNKLHYTAMLRVLDLGFNENEDEYGDSDDNALALHQLKLNL